jgi:hypothetical protein
VRREPPEGAFEKPKDPSLVLGDVERTAECEVFRRDRTSIE